ncbi:MAG TPA: hypothetical protein PK264_05270 [Hyphomicrobiaceae bacterium]|nr:hypothetical protein [Hyphomicrobiaceae bacterium]
MIVMPPAHSFRCARRWTTFERLFAPIARDDDSLLWDAREIAFAVEDPRHWWTVVEGDRGGLYTVAGWHLVNRIGHLCCQHAWGGRPGDHAAYRY